MQQASYFIKDLKSILGRNKYRILIIFFNRAFWGIFSYRLDRTLYNGLGAYYKYLRLFLTPLFYVFQIISSCDIHYRADIKGGINIHHPALGVVISGKSVIGENLTLTGGNIIGIGGSLPNENIIIGNNCNFGANSCLIGPLQIGNFIRIAAMACVVKSYEKNNLVLIGVPAKPKS